MQKEEEEGDGGGWIHGVSERERERQIDRERQ